MWSCRRGTEVCRHDFGDGTIVVDGLRINGFCERVEVAGRLICASGAFEDVTNAISVCVSGTIAPTDAEGIQLSSIAVAIPVGNVGATAVINGAGTIADATCIVCSNALVHIVADAVRVRIGGARPTTVADSIQLVAITIAVSIGNVRAPALIEVTGASTDATGVQLVSIAVAIPIRNVVASTFVDGTGTIAHPTGVQVAHTVVHVITDAVPIDIRRAGASAIADGVQLVAVAIAVSVRDVLAATVSRRSWAVADATGVIVTHTVVHIIADAILIGVRCTVSIAHPNRVRRAHAIVHVVTDSVGVGIRRAASTAHAEGVELVAITIAVSCGNAGATAFLYSSWTVAHATVIEGSNAIIDIVAKTISIGIRCTISVADAQRIQLSDARILLVTHPIGVNVIVAVSKAIFEGLRVSAIVRAPEVTRGIQGERHGRRLSSCWEVLDIERTANVSVGGQLGQQDTPVSVWGAIGVSIEDEPQTANQVVNDHIPA